MTKKLKAACTTMEIQLNDHLIIGENAYYSFSDEGML
jgi:DNA repair protein RadC